ncbi:pyrophosphate--fructose 6-phosphate 1-phosphotransferase [Clostridia bacterium]|nr:pyrophosphate--fructose 6-phosphate 1-phosphotransferase [Clostridia bacterium]
MFMKNLAVAQSGGPTAAINATLCGVIAEAAASGKIGRILGALHGIDGVIAGKFADLSGLAGNERDMKLLRQTPATALGSCRKKLPNLTSGGDEKVYADIFTNLAKENIGAFLYIGGNDSMDTVAKLTEYGKMISTGIKFIGVPKTIDNDLSGTDHTPGFGSAVKYLCTTVQEICRDSNVYDIESVTVIEIMGRDSGWLTASCSLLPERCGGKPQLIYLPEKTFYIEKFLSDVRSLHKSGEKTVIAAVSEGLRDEAGRYAAGRSLSGKRDVFGHEYLAGLGKYIEQEVTDKIGCKVRSIELNVCQRCSASLASKTDLDEAAGAGAAAVRAYLSGETGVMAAMERVSSEPYRIRYVTVPVSDVANKIKTFPKEWIIPAGNGIEKAAAEYFRPLIQGEENLICEDGLPLQITI